MPLGGPETSQLARAAEDALRSKFSELTAHPLDRAGRARTIDEAFLSTVGRPEREAAVRDIKQGDGGELAQPTDPSLYPRFHSARSSCALAVNIFGPWRLDPSSLEISGLGGFKSLSFERRCPIKGVPPERTPPNLDVLAEGETIVGIESKLIEQIRIGATASFSSDYDDAIAKLADDPWRSAIERLKTDAGYFQSFGAGQIAKHYLGMKTLFGTSNPMVLIYLYWEPDNQEAHRFFTIHREEVDEFAKWVSGGDAGFRHLSYPQLLERWHHQDGAHPLSEHVALARERYSLRVPAAGR